MKLWRMCIEPGCGVMGCHSSEGEETVTKDCADCINDGNCPPADADKSHGLCDFHFKKAVEEVEKRHGS